MKIGTGSLSLRCKSSACSAPADSARHGGGAGLPAPQRRAPGPQAAEHPARRQWPRQDSRLWHQQDQGESGLDKCSRRKCHTSRISSNLSCILAQLVECVFCSDRCPALTWHLPVQDPAKTFLSTTNVHGTPQYMAPEQFAGAHCDEKVDVFALATILNECATRRPPWRDFGNAFQASCTLHRMPFRLDEVARILVTFLDYLYLDCMHA